MSINKVCLLGNLGQNPEIRAMTNGKEVATFSVATADVWKDKATGEKKEKTEWHKIVVYNEGLVNIIKQYLKKGDKVYLEGSLQTRKWTDKDGIERYTTEIILQGFNAIVQIISNRKDNQEQDASVDDVKEVFENAEVLEDTIPF